MHSASYFASGSESAAAALQERFRIPEHSVHLNVPATLPESRDYFTFGEDLVCYGRHADAESTSPEAALSTLSAENGGIPHPQLSLPFDPTEVVDNLRRERYSRATPTGPLGSNTVRQLYYAIRPLLPVRVRKYMQRSALRARQHASDFPSWPTDRTVDRLFEKLLYATLKTDPQTSVPFIWFWPEGKQACVLMTHDVETARGLQACDSLMSLNQLFDIPASFQLIPHARYQVTQETLDQMRSRGFEVNVHDWEHDGSLFRNPGSFLKYADAINDLASRWNAKGFRAGALYRNIDWLEKLEVEYDMSVPNSARLDPQSGGCCTIFPWFIGRLLEIPVTMVQDYTLFQLLDDYSLEIWKRQLETILEGSGMASFIVHPDYIQDQRSRAIYCELLHLLSQMRTSRNLWITQPGAVNLWWRQRSQMNLERVGDDQWTITGPGSERARVAFASLQNEQLLYTIASTTNGMPN